MLGEPLDKFLLVHVAHGTRGIGTPPFQRNLRYSDGIGHR